MTLPVQAVLPLLRETLARQGLVVLQAPPGAGKSTWLPLQLLEESWLEGRRIVMLQPRRVAVRGVAARLAETLGEEVGQTVGSRVRFESRVGPTTRVEVVTEGILTRMLQRDPTLEGVGLVILDEFHERSLHADLALALCREVQEGLREDLRLLIMSATLDPALPARLGSKVPLIRTEGRAYPVELRYLPQDPVGPLPEVVARALLGALDRYEGDVLAFLPGAGEIHRTIERLVEARPGTLALPLYGELPLQEQRRALLPDPGGRRKIVLATSIAETSLTLEGVRTVVDSGYARFARFDPGSGLTRLVTERVTADAAAQRAGRAGRTAPGVCLRLWSERTQALLAGARKPEILEADLSGTLLELAQWGVPDPLAMPWLDPPPARHVEAARALLMSLEALDPSGHITERGRRLAEWPTHPRLAHLLLGGAAEGLSALACDVAALLEERDPLREAGREAGSDLSSRLAALQAYRSGRGGPGDRAVLARVERLATQWRKRLNPPRAGRPVNGFDLGALVALAYPERVAQRRPGSAPRYLLASGRGARLDEADELAGSPYLAVAHLDARSEDGRIFLAAELDPARLEGASRWIDRVAWDRRTGALVAQRERRLGALVLDTAPLPEIPAERRAEVAAQALREEGLDLLPWTPLTRQWQARVLSLRAWRPGEGWPDVSDEALLASPETWLQPFLGGVRRREDFGRLDLAAILSGLLPWPLSAQLDTLAPARLTVPSGHAILLDYHGDGRSPTLAVKLQELFGLARTPTVNEGRTPVLLHLLSPAGRPVQVTQDLESFWSRTYPEVRKELAGRYPKHPWPSDPWNAEPTRRTKPRS